jgi:hypothetical protein
MGLAHSLLMGCWIRTWLPTTNAANGRLQKSKRLRIYPGSERGIKLITDFKDMVKKEEQLQFLFQVVEDHRKSISFGEKKATLDAV